MATDLDLLAAQLSKASIHSGKRAIPYPILTIKEDARQSPTLWISKKADENKFSYLSLAKEIRDMIMKFALAPGDVFPVNRHQKTCILCQRQESWSRVQSWIERNRPCVSLLAACRQTYQEGCKYFQGFSYPLCYLMGHRFTKRREVAG